MLRALSLSTVRPLIQARCARRPLSTLARGSMSTRAANLAVLNRPVRALSSMRAARDDAKPSGWFARMLADSADEQELVARAVLASRKALEVCHAHSNREEFYTRLELPDTFIASYRIYQLHVYLYLQRLHLQPEEEAKTFKKTLSSMFWEDVEDRLRVGKMVDSLSQRSTMRSLYESFCGVVMSLDEGIFTGDAVLAGAVWRNVLASQASPHQVALLCRYIRQEARSLEETPFDKILEGEFRFGELGPDTL